MRKLIIFGVLTMLFGFSGVVVAARQSCDYSRVQHEV